MRPRLGFTPAVTLCLMLAAAAPALASLQTIVICGSITGDGSDTVSHGFYVTGYAGANLATVTLIYTATVSGTYDVSLRASLGAFDGPVLGTGHRVLTMAAQTPQTVTFDLGAVPVPANSTIAFSQTALGPGESTLSYQSGFTSCAGIVETADFTPPLSTQGHIGVAVTITAAAGFPCNASPPTAPQTNLCISDEAGDNRFLATAVYGTSQGGGKSGRAAPISLAADGISAGGILYFFTASNPEVLIKVLNGCAINGQYWVFFSAGTNVGFTITVKDTTTGQFKSYTNSDLTAAAPVQDTLALPCS
jgi:hypothetical protein